MDPLQETDTTQGQDDHMQQSQQQCSTDISNPDDDNKTTIPSPHQPSDSNLKMISVEDHEEILKRIQEEHEAIVKRLQLEIERLKDKVYDNDDVMVKEESSETIGSKSDVRQEDINESLNRTEKSRGNRKRPKLESTSNKHDAKWQARYNELKQFQETHGHCNVPTTDEAYKELSKWCQAQRSGYSNVLKGQETILTQDRLKQLNGLNFVWVRSKTQALSWDERFEQLAEFKRVHGHCNPPQKLDEPKGLGNWVLEQRRRYRERNLPDTDKKAKRGPLTEEQIQKMDSLEFEWSLRNRNKGSPSR